VADVDRLHAGESYTLGPVPAAVQVSINVTGDFLGSGTQRAGFVLLVAFLGSWIFIRTSARLIRDPKVTWWPGSVKTKGGLHIHHLVWGICTVLITGFLSFAIRPGSPGLEILAAFFGVGAGLTLDEFALWLRLQDVYWANEGRESVDAVMVAATFGALVVVGLVPLDLGSAGSTLVIAIGIAIAVAYCSISALKGKLVVALCGVFIPVVGVVGAVRLARPSSPWARWFYRQGSRKLERARERYRRIDRRHQRVLNVIAGAPSEPDRAPAPEPQAKA
jgi:hypothetical protein